MCQRCLDQEEYERRVGEIGDLFLGRILFHLGRIRGRSPDELEAEIASFLEGWKGYRRHMRILNESVHLEVRHQINQILEETGF